MLALISALLTPVVVAFVSYFFTSSRRRTLALLKEESEVLGVVTDEEAKAKLREGMVRTAEKYRVRALDLDTVERARRRAGWTFLLGYSVLIVAVGIFIRPVAVMELMDARRQTVQAVAVAVVALDIAINTLMMGLLSQARRVRRRTREQAQDQYEKSAFVEDVRSGNLEPQALLKLLQSVQKSHGDAALVQALSDAEKAAVERSEAEKERARTKNERKRSRHDLFVADNQLRRLQSDLADMQQRNENAQFDLETLRDNVDDSETSQVLLETAEARAQEAREAWLDAREAVLAQELKVDQMRHSHAETEIPSFVRRVVAAD